MSISKKNIVLFLVTCFFISLMPVSLASSKVALISDIRGKVYLKKRSGTEWKPARMTELLKEEDMIKVDTNSYVVVVYFSSNVKETMPGLAVIRVGKDGGTVIEGDKGLLKKEEIKRSLAIPKRDRSLASYKPLGLVEKNIDLLLLTPGPATMNLRPSFSWDNVNKEDSNKVDSYRFIVFSEDDGTIFKEITKEKSISYPEKAGSLNWGNIYDYKIEAICNDEVIGTGVGKIRVLSKAEISQIEEARKAFQEEVRKDREDASAYISMILIYLDHSLYYEALDLCKTLSKLRPEDLEIHQWLMSFYGKIGNKKDADKEEEILKKFQKP